MRHDCNCRGRRIGETLQCLSWCDTNRYPQLPCLRVVVAFTSWWRNSTVPCGPACGNVTRAKWVHSGREGRCSLFLLSGYSRMNVAQRVRPAVAIDASVEKVFGFLDVPENSLALVPQLVEVKEVAPLPNGGHRLRFVTLGRRGKLCEW
jgi:hypothetical protein